MLKHSSAAKSAAAKRGKIVPLLPDDVSALVYRPMFVGGRFTVVRNRFGAPKGLAHEPYAVERHLDRKGRAVDVILTRPVDLKAEVYAAKKARRARAA